MNSLSTEAFKNSDDHRRITPAIIATINRKIPTKDFILELPDKSTGGCSILMCASGRAGKTTCLKYVLEKYFSKHFGILFSESAHAPAYKDMKYSNLPLASVFVPELIKDAYHINKELKNYYDFLFVLDDVPLMKNDKQLLKMLTIYRNSAISGIVNIQSPTLLNPTCRSNFTISLLGYQNTSAQVESVIKAYLRGVFPDSLSYENKIAIYKELTKDHYFLVINNYTGDIFRARVNLQD
tara:strand:+ start:121 stop:837 length:717 start_codon:yes stop_codon:yes gene_type:complete